MFIYGTKVRLITLWISIVVNCQVEGQVERFSASQNAPAVTQDFVSTHHHHLSRQSPEKSQERPSHTITINGDQFMLDGQPLHIISGSLHYFRLPAEYWRDRLQKLKAAGLNSVATYVEWSYHEPEERQYSFEGDRDIAQFVRIAAEEGLHVLLRPGPYICAERDLGGFPYWLLGKYPSIKLRTTDKDFITESKIWMNKLFEQLKPLLFGNGGPIILVQVENEYGSYSNNRAYKEQIRDILLQHVGTNALLYTTDGPGATTIRGGAVSGALTTIDFGCVKSASNMFKSLRQYMPQGPLMNSEFYPGWLTHWGENQQTVSTASVVATLRDMLSNHINLNFYMFFGGTNFEFTAGANHNGLYQPDITSYDYDAPLNEAGDPTPKYYAIRDAIHEFKPEMEMRSVPPPSPKGNYGDVSVAASINLLSPKGRSQIGKSYDAISGSSLPTFETLRQRAGLMLYETTLNDTDGILEVQKPRDWIYVYVDGELAGTVRRMYGSYTLPLKSKVGSVLSLLVETQGRINYGYKLHDYKGILGTVTYKDKILSGSWSVTGYPLQDVNNVNATTVPACCKQGPVIFEGSFTLPAGENPMDTFLDPTGWGKGYVWINGHNLGRYWPSLGPQVTLYVPGVWLRPAPAHNQLRLLELEAAFPSLTLAFIDHPILNRTGVQP